MTVYRALLRQPHLTLAELAQANSLSPAQLRSTLRELQRNGLVVRQPGRSLRYAPIAPRAALQGLLVRRIDDLDRARQEIEELEREFPSVPTTQAVEVIHDPQLAERRWIEMQLTADTEILLFDKPPYLLPLAGQYEAERRLLQRGVSYRVLYDQTSFELPDQPDRSHSFLSVGQKGRLIAEVPFKAVVIDGTSAAVLEGNHPDDPALLVLRKTPLVRALVFTFDALWDRAALLTTGDDSEKKADPGIDTRFLGYLAAGLKDEAIARQLGVSVRTVRRRAAQLLVQLGAHSRFQAGILARQRDWC